jgi:hypothetical protein
MSNRIVVASGKHINRLTITTGSGLAGPITVTPMYYRFGSQELATKADFGWADVDQIGLKLTALLSWISLSGHGYFGDNRLATGQRNSQKKFWREPVMQKMQTKIGFIGKLVTGQTVILLL